VSDTYPCFRRRHGDHDDLHAFPTRRSSDLRWLGSNPVSPLWWRAPRNAPGSIASPVAFTPPMKRRTPNENNQACLRFSRSRLARSEEHTSELQSRENLVCRLLLEKKKKQIQ